MKAVNLLPGDKRASAKVASSPGVAAPSGGSSFGAWLVLGVLAFAVAATAVYVLTTNTVKDRKNELARVQAEAQAMQAKAAQLQSYADFKVLAEGRIATVKGLAKSRFDWERTLTDLSKALPADIHLNSLTGATGTQTSGGSAPSAIQAPSLKLTGCAADQAGVARLMSRLRLVRGVTRVSLAKSDKDGAIGGVTTTPGTEGGSLCPKGAPPAFEMSIYFERSALAAGATPNLGATPAQPGAAQAPGTTAPAQPGAQPQGAESAPGATASAPAAPANGQTTTQPAPGAAGTTQGVSTK